MKPTVQKPNADIVSKEASGENNNFSSLIASNTEIKAKFFEERASDLLAPNTKLQLNEGKIAQRLAALGATQSNQEHLKNLSPEQHAPQDSIGFKNPGLQEGVYKKLRTGRYEVEAKLDLHGLTVEQALKAIVAFVATSMDEQKRCVLISHGKGIKQEQPAKLKNYTAAWLKQITDVMAYHSTLPQHGGTGAVYVLLRKSEKQKLENRERFSNVKKGNS